jgi:hypothetical protein
MKKSVKLVCHVVNSNIAIGSLPSQITGRMYNTDVSIKFTM